MLIIILWRDFPNGRCPIRETFKVNSANSFDIELIENLETGVQYRRTKVFQNTFINLHIIILSSLTVFI